MATASSVTVRAGNDQFRGLFSNTWLVRATLNADSLADGAGIKRFLYRGTCGIEARSTRGESRAVYGNVFRNHLSIQYHFWYPHLHDAC